MRTQYCGLVNAAQLEQTVSLCGWAHRRRDHGGVIFIDLRDREGLVQIVFDPDRPDSFKIAENVRNEYVLRVTGRVRRRPQGTINPALASGEIEVLAQEVEVLNPVGHPPVPTRRRQPLGNSAPDPPRIWICAARRCSTTCGCATRRRWPSAAFSMPTASSTSKPPC